MICSSDPLGMKRARTASASRIAVCSHERPVPAKASACLADLSAEALLEVDLSAEALAEAEAPEARRRACPADLSAEALAEVEAPGARRWACPAEAPRARRRAIRPSYGSTRPTCPRSVSA